MVALWIPGGSLDCLGFDIWGVIPLLGCRTSVARLLARFLVCRLTWGGGAVRNVFVFVPRCKTPWHARGESFNTGRALVALAAPPLARDDLEYWRAGPEPLRELTEKAPKPADKNPRQSFFNLLGLGLGFASVIAGGAFI